MYRVVFNQKGGVGKSTITTNLAAIGAYRGFRTLVIDLDAQANSTHYLLGNHAEIPSNAGVAGFFEQTLNFTLKEQGIEAYVMNTPFEGLDVMPASPMLHELHSKLESRYKIYKLRKALEALGDTYDRIWIDTPPSLNFYSRSALIAAQGCLIPFDCDDFSRRALYGLIQEIDDLRGDHNPELQIQGIVVNQFQPRARLPAELVQALQDEGLPVLQPYLSSSVKVRESHQLSRPLVHLDARHKLTTEYTELFLSLPGEQIKETNKQSRRARAA